MLELLFHLWLRILLSPAAVGVVFRVVCMAFPPPPPDEARRGTSYLQYPTTAGR